MRLDDGTHRQGSACDQETGVTGVHLRKSLRQLVRERHLSAPGNEDGSASRPFYVGEGAARSTTNLRRNDGCRVVNARIDAQVGKSLMCCNYKRGCMSGKCYA